MLPSANIIGLFAYVDLASTDVTYKYHTNCPNNSYEGNAVPDQAVQRVYTSSVASVLQTVAITFDSSQLKVIFQLIFAS
jgi:hypothetical protein